MTIDTEVLPNRSGLRRAFNEMRTAIDGNRSPVPH